MPAADPGNGNETSAQSIVFRAANISTKSASNKTLISGISFNICITICAYPEAVVSPGTGVIISIDKESKCPQAIVNCHYHCRCGVSNVLSIIEESVGVSLRWKIYSPPISLDTLSSPAILLMYIDEVVFWKLQAH